MNSTTLESNWTELLQGIGRLAFSKIPGDWKKSEIEAMVLYRSCGLKCFYETSNSPEIKQYKGGYELAELFEDLQSSMKKSDNSPQWNRAKYTLFRDGKYEIDFKWDQELADEIAELNKIDDSRLTKDTF